MANPDLLEIKKVGTHLCFVESVKVDPGGDTINWKNNTSGGVVILFPVPGEPDIEQIPVGPGGEASLYVKPPEDAEKGDEFAYAIYITDYTDAHFAFAIGGSHPRMIIGSRG